MNDDEMIGTIWMHIHQWSDEQIGMFVRKAIYGDITVDDLLEELGLYTSEKGGEKKGNENRIV